MTAVTPDGRARWDELRRAEPIFRRHFMTMTLVTGRALLFEAPLRVPLVLVLPYDVTPVVSPFSSEAVVSATAWWSIHDGTGTEAAVEAAHRPSAGWDNRTVTDLAQRIDRTCHLQGTFTLRSGQVSHEYFDKYLFEADPALLRAVAQAMVPLVPECDLLAGMELGGIPIATVLSQLTGRPTVFVRKQAKGYGTDKVAEGPEVSRRRVVVVEDVVTTGGALLTSCADLRSAGAIVDTVLCAIDREQGGRENLAEAGLTLRPVLTRTDLESSRPSS